jgi:hypothetical protein
MPLCPNFRKQREIDGQLLLLDILDPSNNEFYAAYFYQHVRNPHSPVIEPPTVCLADTVSPRTS